jgi:uncharacterized protein (TIGR03000 family)
MVLMAALTAGTATPEWGWRGCHGCHGCWGCHGCSGYGCHGCYGYGCYGCYGCWGYGGGYGGWGYGCYGCYGGCYGCYGGCYGYGCYGCYANGGGSKQMKPADGGGAKDQPPKPEGSSRQDGQARLIVELPENAKLYVDDHLMKSASNRRSFITPELQAGQTYFYILRAEVDRDGKTVAQSKRVTLRAGQLVETSFVNMQAESTAQADARTER